MRRGRRVFIGLERTVGTNKNKRKILLEFEWEYVGDVMKTTASVGVYGF